VYVNTAQEFDGSDAGARPDEAVSWGKIRLDARPVKVYADATLVFPLIVSQTFMKNFEPKEEEEEEESQQPAGSNNNDTSSSKINNNNNHNNNAI